MNLSENNTATEFRVDSKRNSVKRKNSVFLFFFLLFPVVQFIIFYIGVNINSILLAFQEYDSVNGVLYFNGFSTFCLTRSLVILYLVPSSAKVMPRLRSTIKVKSNSEETTSSNFSVTATIFCEKAFKSHINKSWHSIPKLLCNWS